MVNIPAEPVPGSAFECIHGYEGGADFATALQHATASYHGVAGRIFLENLVKHRNEKTIRAIRNKIDEFVLSIADAKTNGQVQRVARHFGLLYAAGNLATGFNLTGWEHPQVSTAIRKCFDAWLASRGGDSASHEDLTIVTKITGFLFQNIARFQDGATIDDDTVMVQRRLGYLWKGNYYIKDSELKTICSELRLSSVNAENVLRAQGIITSNRDNKNIAAVKVNVKTIRAHVISLPEQPETEAHAAAE
jgi:putative DNA primase/helicase